MSLALAYALKYNFTLPVGVQAFLWQQVLYLCPIKIALLIGLGEFKGIFSYFRLPDLVKIVTCLTGFAFILLVLRASSASNIYPSREIILSDLLFSILFILFFRTSLRIINGRTKTDVSHPTIENRLKVAVIGTNEFSSQIVCELMTKNFYGVYPVAVLDDNPHYYGRTLHGVPVLGQPELLRDLAERQQISGVVFVGDTISKARLTELSDLAKSLNLKKLTVPSFQDFLEGRAFVSQLRPLEVEDFLQRPPIRLDLKASAQAIENQVVCITGAGGSIGSELSLQVAKLCPAKLILLDHCEYNLFRIQQKLHHLGYSCVPLLVNIAHKDLLRATLERYRPDIIFHAAAYKHVPLLEDQPLVAVQNNILGTGWLAQYACELGVKKFVLISTDKAINPINNMGATKRICEMLCMKAQEQAGNKTSFMAVRFGNVLGSAGSVLPTFREQIAYGGPVTVTHPEMTRFFMTIPEAVSLILEAFSFKTIAGSTYVLDMGQPVKILDVAKHMIELNNLRVGTDIQIVFTGIRPGEKLHEDLVYDPKTILPTAHKLIGVFKDNKEYLKKMHSITQCMEAVEALQTNEESVRFLESMLPEFGERVAFSRTK